MYSSAARTNFTSQNVQIHTHDIAGERAFRIAYGGTYIGGNWNQQEAICKSFKPKYRVLENDFYAKDFKTAEKAIEMAEDWNEW